MQSGLHPLTSLPIRFLVCALLLQGTIRSLAGQVPARSDPPTGRNLTIRTNRFVLRSKGQTFFLQLGSPAGLQRLSIPRDWLIPPLAEQEEEEMPVSSFKYDREVTSSPSATERSGFICALTT
jgi:hypothetical protein